ncbi:MAG: tRNA pseudouridine(55) synthase TruB [Candidatus Omnitrophica bacterium]|nr:tRNA pseudouridine(55) synthase TruB [Candidatus Omnitrophota bacterium]
MLGKAGTLKFTSDVMDGILIVDKAKGMTSHDVVDLVRKRFGIKKAGHGGTLDPMATGVLVLLIGKYTKSSATFLSDDKEYEGTFVLGATSDTGDAYGKITERNEKFNGGRHEIEEVFRKFTGELEQKPPMYSAVKHKGRKLYQLARKGETADVAPRKITIKNLEVLNLNLPEVSFKTQCSKGTYIRQLCADMGERLGCGAYLSALRRTRSGKFGITEAISVEELKRINAEELGGRLLREG